jgi:hypothetical protein
MPEDSSIHSVFRKRSHREQPFLQTSRVTTKDDYGEYLLALKLKSLPKIYRESADSIDQTDNEKLDPKCKRKRKNMKYSFGKSVSKATSKYAGNEEVRCHSTQF